MWIYCLSLIISRSTSVKRPNGMVMRLVQFASVAKRSKENFTDYGGYFKIPFQVLTDLRERGSRVVSAGAAHDQPYNQLASCSLSASGV